MAKAFSKNRPEVKTLEAQSTNFTLTLESKATSTNPSNHTTRFKNTLKRPIFLNGDCEVALEKVYFSNVSTTDLGQIEITYFVKDYRSSYVQMLAIKSEMGITYKSLFEQINNEIESNFKEREYKERLGLRKKHNLPNNNNILKLSEEEISLPVKDSPIYDDDVYQEIKDMCPKIVYEENKLYFRMKPEFSIKFYGNILNLITELTDEKYSNSTLPLILKKTSLPNFSTCLIITDLIENEYFGESEIPLLKFMCMESKDKLQNQDACKTFDLKDNSYKLLKKDKQLINTIKDINITIKTDFDNILEFDQGDVILQLHFRKKNGL